MFVLPINQERGSQGTPPLIIGLILIDGVVLLAEYVAGPMQAIFLHWGFVPAQPRLLTLFTSQFLHAGIWHYAGNMFFLWMFGKQTEECLGRWLLGAAFLLSGVGGNLLHYAFNQHSLVPCVGASGAISGIMGVFCVLFPKAEFELVFYFGWFRLGSTHSPAWGAVLAWVGEQTVLGILTKALGRGGVAYWAHVGGFLIGLCFGYVYFAFHEQRVKNCVLE